MKAAAKPLPLHRLVYALLITLAAGTAAGHILAAQRVYEPTLFRDEHPIPDDPRGQWPATRPAPTPMFGSNDRSRWATIEALVDKGTYVIGHRRTDPQTGSYTDDGIAFEDGWQGQDKVLRPEKHDHVQDFYSSKPPFLATLVAGEYWLLKHGLGWEIRERRFSVVRVILFSVNWLPFLIYLALLARLVDRFGVSDWGRLYVMAAACLGTFVTPFLVTLNNHTIATFTALFALYPALRLWEGESRAGWLFAVTGFFAGFTACTELPAASFAAALLLLLLWRAPWRTLGFFVPAALLPVAAFLLTNYLALGRLTPAYSEFGGPWYEYAGSPWQKPEPGHQKHGIDWAGNYESRAQYAFNVFLGHHGFFSLTPIFLLALVGMIGYLWHGRRAQPTPGAEPDVPVREPGLRLLIGLTLIVSAVVMGFYLYKSTNYGGFTSGLRWLMWLTPLWLLSLLPAADWLSHRRWARGLGYVLLAFSTLSVNYPPWNPWRHPWIYDFMSSMDWFHY